MIGPVPALLTEAALRAYVRGRMAADAPRSRSAWAFSNNIDGDTLGAFLLGAPPPPRLLNEPGFERVTLYRSTVR